MKKLNNVLAIMALTLALTACGGDDERLAQLIDIQQETLDKQERFLDDLIENNQKLEIDKLLEYSEIAKESMMKIGKLPPLESPAEPSESQKDELREIATRTLELVKKYDKVLN